MAPATEAMVTMAPPRALSDGAQARQQCLPESRILDRGGGRLAQARGLALHGQPHEHGGFQGA